MASRPLPLSPSLPDQKVALAFDVVTKKMHARHDLILKMGTVEIDECGKVTISDFKLSAPNGDYFTLTTTPTSD